MRYRVLKSIVKPSLAIASIPQLTFVISFYGSKSRIKQFKLVIDPADNWDLFFIVLLLLLWLWNFFKKQQQNLRNLKFGYYAHLLIVSIWNNLKHYRIQVRTDITGTARYQTDTDTQSINQSSCPVSLARSSYTSKRGKGRFFPHTKLGPVFEGSEVSGFQAILNFFLFRSWATNTIFTWELRNEIFVLWQRSEQM